MSSPQFRTAYDPGTGETWIVDAGQPAEQRIARIRPPRLHDLVLRPGEPASVTWLTLFWWQYADNERPGRSAWLVDEVRLDDSDPACYRLRLRSHNAGRSVESLCHLALTCDPARDSYVYDVQTEFAVQPGRTWLIEPQGGVEFADPWYKEAVGPAIPYEGARPGRWSWVLYTDPAGEIVRLPLNHLGIPASRQIRFPASGGWLGFFDRAATNPVIELDPETSGATRAEVCAWGYDVHFIRRVLPDACWEPDPRTGEIPDSVGLLHGGARFRAGYRLCSESAERGAALLARSSLPHLAADVADRLARPAYCDGLNSFERGVWPLEPNDAWFWSPSHADGLVWDREYGCRGPGSLHIHNLIARQAHWEAPVGPDFWMGPLSKQPQRLTGWLRADQVRDGAASIGFRYSNYEIEMGRQPRWPEYLSAPLSGTQDWTRLSVPIDAPPAGATRGYIRLALSGVGDAWFDDVALGPASDDREGMT